MIAKDLDHYQQMIFERIEDVSKIVKSMLPDVGTVEEDKKYDALVLIGELRHAVKWDYPIQKGKDA